MTLSTNQSLTVRLFLGYPLSSEIRMYLKKSTAWKQVKISPNPGQGDLIEVHFQEKDYIGSYILKEQLTFQELKTMENSIHEALLRYCPELAQENLKIYLFPQIFIS